jgi:two-component system response regulator HydG
VLIVDDRREDRDPPLRHRRDDIPALLSHFLERARKCHSESAVAGFSNHAIEQLLDHRWPGNVRELEHLVERMVLLGRAAEIEADELPRTTSRCASASFTLHGDIVTSRDMQSRYATWVLETLGGRRMLTAEKLAVDIKTLARLLKTEPDQDPNES